MAFNSIEDTTSFSGSDITVVAYRGSDDPTTRFALQELEAKRKDLVRESNQLNQKGLELSRKRDVANRNAEFEKELLASSIQDNPGGGFNYRNNNGGSFQNYNNLINRAGELEKEINSVKAERSKINNEVDIVSSKESALRNIPYFTLGSIHTVSYSSFREKFAVRSLGRTQAKTYTRGPRTVAGTMVFNILQEHELLKLLGDANAGQLDSTGMSHPQAVMLDQVQPFNLMFLFANEYGSYSAMHLFNIDLSSEGQEMSVDSIITHNTMNFYATDMIPLRSLGSNWENYDQMINGEVGTGINQLSSSSEKLGLRDKSRVDGKGKTKSMEALLAQSRGLF